MANCDVATGITVTFPDSGFSMDLIDVNPFDASRESIDCTHQGSAGTREFDPSDLVDWGDMTITGAFDQDVAPPIDQAKELIEIEFPKKDSLSASGALISGQGFMTAFSVTGALETKIEFEATIKWAGSLDFTAEA